MKVSKEFEIVKEKLLSIFDGASWRHLFKDLDDRYKRHQHCINCEIKEGDKCVFTCNK